jgi:hypothetical protein
MSTTTSSPLQERDRLLDEEQQIARQQQAANARRREAEAAVPRAQKHWHEALAAKARGAKNGARKAEEAGAAFALAQTELEAAEAETEAVALAARQVANELDLLHHRQLPAFVDEAVKTDLGIRGAAKAAQTAMLALGVAWAGSDAAWRPLSPAIRTHVAAVDQDGGVMRGDPIQDAMPRQFPQQFRDALALLGAAAQGQLTARPLALARRVQPDPEDVISVKLDVAAAIAEVRGER